MTPERFQQIDRLVDLALEQKNSERAAFLDKACSGDEELRREVESLLASDERNAGFLAETPARIAADLLTGDGKETRAEGSPSLSPPGALGRYVVHEEIGRGGMGVVYAAYDPELDRKVAIKLMRPETSETISASEGRVRLMREAQAMARISHPNVIAVHDVGTIGDQVFIAMEYAEGRTLSQWLTEGNRPWRQVLDMFVQAGRGLAAAHVGGILHRDFKPANVLVDRQGRARVVDFGLARPAEPVKTEERNTGDGQAPADTKTTPRRAMLGAIVTQRGQFLGTPAYMAPEQLIGARADEKTDQYSFCVALFQGLYGELPFNAENLGALLDQIKKRKVNEAPKLSSVPSSLHHVLLRGLSPAPEDRYESMDHLLHELTRRPRTVWRVSLTALVILAVLLAIGRFASQTPNPQQLRSIAVLPLENLSHDPQQEYLADGLTDELITNLSKVASLRVIARGSTMKYKSRPSPIREIAKELKVNAVLRGTVLPSGDEVQITTQLIDTSSETTLWAARYNGSLSDVFGLQNRVARAVIAGIRLKLTPVEEQRLSRIQPVNSDAYLAYLRGLFYFQKGWAIENDVYTAIDMFERATALSPEFALAYARLAMAYDYVHYSFNSNEEIGAKAFVAAKKSLSLDPNLPEAYVARGMVAEDVLHSPEETAIQDFQRAVALSPNLPEPHWHLAGDYLHMGLLDEALSELHTVLAVDPYDVRARYYIARAHLYQQDYDEAFLDFQRNPDFAPKLLWQKALILFYRGEKTAAHELIDELRRKLPDNEDVASTYAVLLADEGKNEEAEEQIGHAVRTGEGRHHFHHAEYNIASAYALMGHCAEAVRWLRRTAEHRLTAYPLFERDPHLNNLRTDPDFKAWLSEMKSLWERRRAAL